MEDRKKFVNTMNLIGNLFENTLQDSNFRTVPNFYGLFIALYHMNYTILNLEIARHKIDIKDYPKIRNCLDEINCILESEDELPKEYYEFIKSTRDATTDVPARTIRCKFIVNKLLEVL